MKIEEYFLAQTMGSIRRFYPELTERELRAKAAEIVAKTKQMDFTGLPKKRKNVKLYIY